MAENGNTSDRPQYAIGVVEDETTGVNYAWLIVSTQQTVHQFVLCGLDDFRNVARVFNDNILKAGQEMQQRKTGLVTVKGLPDGLVSAKKGRP